MKRNYIIGLLFLCMLIGAKSFAAENNSMVLLFNGMTSKGWVPVIADEKVKQDEVWSINVGQATLRCEGKPLSFLVTENGFSDYKLSFQWRWAAKSRVKNPKLLSTEEMMTQGAAEAAIRKKNYDAREAARKAGTKPFDTKPDPEKNAGLIIHASKPNKDNFYPQGLGIDLKSGSAGDFFMLGETIEVDKKKERLKEKRRILNTSDIAENPEGDWNEMTVIAVGNKVTVFINGIMLNKGFKCSASGGFICLTSDGDPIEYREILLMHGTDWRIPEE